MSFDMTTQPTANRKVTGKSVAIIQSNYIPWKGYFDIINSVDEFILFDEVQYTRSDWRNRNKIVCAGKPVWLSIPIATKHCFEKPISSMTIADPKWSTRHLRTINQFYVRAPHFDEMFPRIQQAYEQSRGCEFLSQVNLIFINAICDVLGIQTEISFSTRYRVDPDLRKTERLLALCKASGATRYLSGPAAKAYLDEELFRQAEIEVEYMNYDGYLAYRQCSERFEHGVSIIDLLLNEGGKARQFMKSFT